MGLLAVKKKTEVHSVEIAWVHLFVLLITAFVLGALYAPTAVPVLAGNGGPTTTTVVPAPGAPVPKAPTP